ncbi:MAG: HAD hydrolase-like protein [Chloroflexota bacterium]|nr:HAD hydrolase-like protein [Chloroflexota bacterium]
MRANEKRILLFDIDGTLLDPHGEGHTCMRRALIEVYGVAGPMETYDMAGKTDWQIITDLMRLAGVDEATIDNKLLESFQAYARHVEKAAQSFYMQLLPGVSDLLNCLMDDPRFILGLVTGNVRESVPHKLRAVGLVPTTFRFGAYGSENINRNLLPSLALERLERILSAPVARESVLVIGDTPHDVACARHAGVKVLCVATGNFDRETLAGCSPDYLLDDLNDTETVLRILNQF